MLPAKPSQIKQLSIYQAKPAMTLPSPLLKFLSFPWPILIGFINPSKDPVWPTYTTIPSISEEIIVDVAEVNQ